jgi:hypothetical protein
LQVGYYAGMFVTSKIKSILREIESYAPVMQALSIARTITVVLLSVNIMVREVWADTIPCLDKIRQAILTCIHSIL